MLYDYRQESKTPMLLTLANGNTIEGEFRPTDRYQHIAQRETMVSHSAYGR